MVLNDTLGIIFGSVFHFWNCFGSLGTLKASHERTTLEPFTEQGEIIDKIFQRYVFPPFNDDFLKYTIHNIQSKENI